ncbi:hypothetical protein B0T20DRAFT_219540 [Sordaria brevicollis]|uniref:Uncharacterized protein n=1 Tax=Sordaria brevicollis TaxID=83679 RepID=A0AAE0UCX5_SORBR|nr:hypothetical protein B0T20DRAFT_219540 [Sordaria brevicollis]
METDFDTIQELGPWTNVSPRSASGRAIGFTMSDTDTARSILEDVKYKLEVLRKKIPAYAGKLQLGKYLTEDMRKKLAKTGTKSKDGKVYLLKHSEFRIDLRVCYPTELQGLYQFPAEYQAHAISFMTEYLDYAELKKDGFPVEAFINNKDLNPYHENENLDPFFYNKEANPFPVLTVQIVFLKGGFLLNPIPHHTLFDGMGFGGKDGLLDRFACELGDLGELEETEPEKVSLEHTFDFPYAQRYPQLADVTYEQLLKECPEYCRDNALKGPTQPVTPAIRGAEDIKRKNTSKIFVINYDNMTEYRDGLVQRLQADPVNPVEREIGVYPVICALVWAHTFVAREKLAKEVKDPIETVFYEHFKSRAPIFSTPYYWANKKFLDANPEFGAHFPENYFGNRVTWAYTKLDSAFPDCPPEEDAVEMAYQLLREAAAGEADSVTKLAAHVHDCIHEKIDGLYVAKRHALFDKASDVRELGLSMDPRMPGECGMNTWKDYGMGIKYHFNAMTTKADFQRRVQDGFGESGGLILPAEKPTAETPNKKNEIELQLSLSEEAMKILLKDEIFGKHYRRVVQSRADPLPVLPGKA